VDPGDDDLIAICNRVVDAVIGSLVGVEDWALLGSRPGQYALDLLADAAALDVLNDAGLGILSEESGITRPGSPLMAVIDPVDGSTNASRRVPWYASSICVLDEAGPRAAVVANLATGVRYHAVRGGGAWRDDTVIGPSDCRELRKAVVGLSGFPARHLGWAQFRAFGAAALDLCSVAEGSLDAFTVGGRAHLGPWDYMGGLLVCTEAGAVVSDLEGAALVTTDFGARRAVVAAATPELMGEVISAIAGGPTGNGGPPRAGGQR
jgi:myo-inositol-1(or 4)-monophosphatase